MTRTLALLLAVAFAGCGAETKPTCGPVARAAGEARLSTVQASVRDSAGRQRMLVGLRPGASSKLVEASGGEVLRELRHTRAVTAMLPPAVATLLRADPAVAYVEPDRVVHALGTTGVDLEQGDVSEYVPGITAVQAPDVWDRDRDGRLDPGAPAGEGVKVCVIDSGIDPGHPELAGAYLGGWDFVDGDDDPTDRGKDGRPGGGHGTHVAATIAARLGHDGAFDPAKMKHGVAGVAPRAGIYALRVLDETGEGRTSDIVEALGWCRQHGGRVASLSLGSDEASDTERDAFADATRAGLVVVAASGNGGGDLDVGYPAAYPGVIAVGATDNEGRLGAFSQTGDAMSLVAPGLKILSASLRGAGASARFSISGGELAARPVSTTARGVEDAPVVDCGLADTRDSCHRDACEPFVAYVDRGGATFADKVRNVMEQGAVGVVVGDNEDDGPGDFALVPTWPWSMAPGEFWAPTVAVSKADGARVRGLAGSPARLELFGIDYMTATGTSMSTPHVAGVAALVLSARPGTAGQQVKSILESTAKDLGPRGWDKQFGFGMVQAKAAVDAALKLP